DPESKLLLAIDVGHRTLAMAQRVVHQVAQVLAPDCAPLFLTDGFREYLTALLPHYGRWVQPPRRQDKGPHPKPRWMPLPQLLYALCLGWALPTSQGDSKVTSEGVTPLSQLLRAHASDHGPPHASVIPWCEVCAGCRESLLDHGPSRHYLCHLCGG